MSSVTRCYKKRRSAHVSPPALMPRAQTLLENHIRKFRDVFVDTQCSIQTCANNKMRCNIPSYEHHTPVIIV
jgi:hypothetical protein